MERKKSSYNGGNAPLSRVKMQAEVIANCIGSAKLWQEKGINLSLQGKKKKKKMENETLKLRSYFHSL